MHDTDYAAAATVATRRASRPIDPLACLCGDIAAVLRRVWGRGPVNTSAHWAGANILVVVLQDGHTEAERTMRAVGHVEQLMDGRRLLHSAVEDELTSSVARNLGRHVETVLSATRLDPDLSVEIFFLEPSPGGSGDERPVTDRAARAVARAHELTDDARALGAQQLQVERAIQARRQRQAD